MREIWKTGLFAMICKIISHLAVILLCLTSACTGQSEQVSMTMLLKGQYRSNLQATEYQCYVSNPSGSTRVTSLRKVSTRNPLYYSTSEGEVDRRNLPPPPAEHTEGTYPHWKVASTRASRSNNGNFGVFGCQASQTGRRDTEILGIFMRSDADIVPHGGLFTKTVNLGETNVNITMERRGSRSVSQFRWLKDNVRPSNTLFTPNGFNGVDTWSINHPVRVDDAGVYECHINHERNDARQGLKLLIVRACPRNTWGSSCNQECQPCYNGGVCDEVTGSCICAPGFKGSDCSEVCGGNSFGHECEFRCSEFGGQESCQNYLFCLAHPYGCTCNAGWRGLECNQVCLQGTYGASCLGTCHCRSGSCNRFTGLCDRSSGCTEGWTGTNCQQVTECRSGTFGIDCGRECHCQSGSCDRQTGICSNQAGCESGWQGDSCDEACGQRKFGRGCRQTCHCQSGDCNKRTGMCTEGYEGRCSHGWRGPSCNQECSFGTYGIDCESECHCQVGGCNRQTGICTNQQEGCASGWQGTSCHQACGRRKFGRGCRQTCHCLSGDCNKQTGSCAEGNEGRCSRGWRGLSCDQECSFGTFGNDCDSACHCQSGGCNRQTGICTNQQEGCASGWQGTSCHQACGPRKFGRDCRRTCHCLSGDCNKQTGRCAEGIEGRCSRGWKGSSCDQACRPGEFGTDCRRTCHCKSNDCNKQTGDCTGEPAGCTLGWKGSSCNQAIPVLKPPRKSSVNAHSVTIHWSSGNSTVDGYIPYYKHASGEEWIPGSSTTIDRLSFNFTNLASETLYSFSVAIVSDGYEGLKSPNLTIATLCPVPPSPANITSELVSENKDRLKISWMIPGGSFMCSSGGSNLTVYYSRLNKTGEKQEIFTDSGATFHVLRDQAEEGTYMIKMSLTTAGGESARSYPIFHSITNVGGSDFCGIRGNSQGKDNEHLSIPLIIILSCVVVALLIYIIIYPHCKKRWGELSHWKSAFNSGKTSGKLPQHASGRKYAQNGDMAVSSLPPDCKEEIVMEDLHEVMDMPHATAEPVYSNTEKPVPVLIRDLEKYVRKCEAASDSGSYEAQFQLFKPGKQHEWEVGEQEANKPKNRFKNMVAYDHSRVILEKLEGDPYSDYFNANYIENAFGALSYIASQGPNTASLDDFWRVIWQEKVSNVVMLTKIVERGKNRCKQYWPKAIGVSQCYGDYLVTWDSKQEYADYVIRYMRITCLKGDVSRDVVNWHFLSWQDMGVPSHPTPLIEMAQKIKAHQDTLTTPLLVHCSAGVGRTGTFIALCELMSVIQSRERVDIFGYVEQMRQSRVMMIQTAAQYKFLHECLLEFYLTGCTEISATDISSFSVHGNKEKLLREYALINKLAKSPKGNRRTAPEEKEKSRFPSLLPVESKRPYIETKSHSSHYINACLTSSLTRQDAYIATQSPLPTTVEDFWALVYGWKCPIIVMLNSLDPTDASCCKYWPDESCPLEVGHMTVELAGEEDRGFYMYRTFNMTQKYDKKKMVIHQLQLKSWDVERCHDIIQLIVQLERLEEVVTFKGPPIVHCIDGVGNTGVFLATKSEMERLRLEHRVNVFSTVLQLRESNINFIISQDDYNLCHLMVKMEVPESAYGNI